MAKNGDGVGRSEAENAETFVHPKLACNFGPPSTNLFFSFSCGQFSDVAGWMGQLGLARGPHAPPLMLGKPGEVQTAPLFALLHSRGALRNAEGLHSALKDLCRVDP